MQTEANPSVHPFLVIHDDLFEQEARSVARTLALEVLHVRQLATRRLDDAPNIFVDVNLRDFETVKTFKKHVGRSPAGQTWAFAVPVGADRHIWQVQADALGATSHLRRDTCIRDLRRMMSIARQSPVPASRVAALGKAAGGAAILGAGRQIARLFDGVLTGNPVTMKEVSTVGAEVLQSVNGAGADAWLDTVRQYHEGTFQHCLLVTGTVAAYAEKHVVGAAEARALLCAALLHDIGKAAVPVHILDKPGRLTADEFDAIKLHPGVGYDYLRTLDRIDPLVLDAVRHHHEALDGSGYPDRLRGSEIKALTRILTVCDIFAALVEARSYKPARPPDEAIAILVRMALEDKVDYAVVRNLAQVFDMAPPDTANDVKHKLAAE